MNGYSKKRNDELAICHNFHNQSLKKKCQADENN